MFTVDQIKAAHAKVKSGSDFPAYIKEMKQLGVTAFETWVVDSHTEYFGIDNYATQSQPMYAALDIANVCNNEKFEHLLSIHQQGQTDYITFCNDCATTGIEKWFVSLIDMTCTYFDKAANKVLTERIPG